MRDKMFVVVPSIIWILCGIVALFYFSTSLPIKITISEDNMSIYEHLSFHMWILEMLLLTVGISVAVLGFIGYQSIRNEAVNKATEEAVNRATEEARREFTRWEDNIRGLMLVPDLRELRSTDHQVQEEPSEEDVSDEK